MSDYSIVPNAALTATADAIRTKSGSQATIEFDHNTGFKDAVDAIPSGDTSLDDYINGVSDIILESDTVTTVSKGVLRGYQASFSVSFPNCITINEGAFYQSFIKNAYFPEVTTFSGRNQFRSSRLEYAIFPKLTSLGSGDAWELDSGTKNYLLGVDLGALSTATSLTIPQWTFYYCTAVVIILRYPQLCPLGNINAFEKSRYGSGGTGGTIYIPKALYDHLGDGTSLDYKAATNWSTIDGYGTITWAAIEGSQYENYYADGTPISTT